MKLSTQVDYAVRAVYELARCEPGRMLHTDEIAAAQRIPKARLAKVVQDLARADLVRTVRGRAGGVVLARPASGGSLVLEDDRSVHAGRIVDDEVRGGAPAGGRTVDLHG